MSELFGTPEFWPHLFQAKSFWAETVPIIVGTFACLALMLGLLVWRYRKARSHVLARARALPRANGGAAAVSDFALTIPIFIMVTFVVLQLALMANASVIVHYAAYNAARAAKTHLIDMDTAFLELECCLVPEVAKVLMAVKLYQQAANNADDEVTQKVRTAAAFPLIALAPGKEDYIASNPSPAFRSSNMEAYLRLLAGNEERAKYLIQKASYAFDNRFTKVEYGTPLKELLTGFTDLIKDSGNDNIGEAARKGAEYGTIAADLAGKIVASPASAAARITSIPVFAAVSFRFPLLVPYAAAIFNKDDPALRSSNAKGIWLSARVELL